MFLRQAGQRPRVGLSELSQPCPNREAILGPIWTLDEREGRCIRSRDLHC